ncbi:ferredoxin-type protein NapG [Enterovibrio sp. ZSDZ35]|uniref:Ferredoxin-type protein NapG n=1 Tax=Enterovibrio qingdaonensis TaxID=2899818 RepID=A0ABT5QIP8_9GAMM|nr:ferredoxin-type protein NapG [Enterovibrio sp. ZSDZ35]MDD1780863.1 ferredoxin-type protein NapG [Enterovibrio sp. ZSDZ35]
MKKHTDLTQQKEKSTSLSGGSDTSRRRFLRDAARTAAGAGIAVTVLGLQSKQSQAQSGIPIRPPGALEESDFLNACVRCGLCVRDCPYDTLKLATLLSPVAAGTPYFDARSIPCEMCEDIPCVVACPSGALNRDLTDITEARMGTAVLIDHENCLNWQGLRCDVCYRVCPLIDEAITLEPMHNQRTGKHAKLIPMVNADRCTGCGLCEHACVLDETAIKVVPTNLARGKLGEHYRLGWEEKAANDGESLVPRQLTLPIRAPLEGN